MSGRGLRSLVAAATVAIVVAACGTTTARPTSVKPTVPAPSPSPAAVGFSVSGCASTGRLVTSAAELDQALASAAPGMTILLAPGTYTGHFVAKTSGTSSDPISLCGARESVLDGGDHVIAVGRVLDLGALDIKPLLFFRGGYGRFDV